MTYEIITLPNRANDLTGRVFGRLIAIAPVELNRRVKWLCICKCGTETVVISALLSNGQTQSCGCLGTDKRRFAATKHGKSTTPEYKAWHAMHDRVSNHNHKCFRYYGGRDISVCAQWADFTVFLADMGKRPSAEYSIDRIDNNGNYAPDNCRWATRSQQMNNRSVCRHIAYNGRTQTVAQWAKEYGLGDGTLHNRLFMYKWSIKKALTTPVRKNTHRK